MTFIGPDPLVVWQLTFVGAAGPTAEDCVAALISGVLVHAVVMVPEAFMMGAVGPSAEDLVAVQLNQLTLWRRVGWWHVCSSQVFGRSPSGS